MPKVIVPHGLTLIRDRLAPKPEPTARLEPHTMIAQLVDERGRVVWESEPIHNLVLTQASEAIAAQPIANLANYAVVGTGSTAPSAGNTALVAELVRTNNNAGIADTLAEVNSGVWEFTRTRQFTAAQVGGQNLTEWGFSHSGVAAANLNVRELMRDGSNNPVTVTPGASQDLRLIYKYRVTVGPTAPLAGSINIAGIGMVTGQSILYKNDLGGNPNIVALLSSFFRGDGTQLIFGVYANGLTLNYNALSAPVLGNGGTNDSIALSWNAYTPGSKQRLSGALAFGSGQANQSIKGIAIQQGNYGIGMLFQFDNGQEFTKDNLHSLTFDPWTVSWT